ncbi:uncharacterized protein PV09_03552 [Verruconis gallopava]|uniref:PQ-loop-domain-containing protein n=1 Tax=Verruconis gallopava TaxID=253628 RepID=A0A0D2AGI1_9PEZI|nr:uncharacterized protein PV09_03552 [Verruconis gallopava]KIW05690.1 hypothetical protein PV09_03552 [Verruconis gallopava]
MFPPIEGVNLSITALSGICGSISIACWIVVFSPQIAENFRSQAEGLSVAFIVVWSLGDVFNALGGILQGVLPTMIILAVYYLLVDIVLLGQCFYYKGFSLTDRPVEDVAKPNAEETGPSATEHTRLLLDNAHDNNAAAPRSTLQRTASQVSFHERLFPVDATHLSPATPLHSNHAERRRTVQPPRSLLQSFLVNFFVVLLVLIAGVFGWFLSHLSADAMIPDEPVEAPSFNVLGQVFGYICSVLYLGSRVPQLLLNHRRRTTDGISMLFFLFACIGNATYNISIFAYSPESVCEVPMHCKTGEAAQIYWKHIAVNLSWIIGSLGTLILDMGVFVQYFMYKKESKEEEESEVSSDDNTQTLF